MSPSAWTMCWRPSAMRYTPLSSSGRGDLAAVGPGQDPFVRGDFGGIVQRRELRDATPRQRAPDQMVGQVRVLGQQRAVKVGAEDASLDAAFGVVLTVVAKAHAHTSEGLGLGPEISAAAMVLEADEGRRLEVGQVGIHDHVADEAPLAGLGAHVDEADAREPLAIGGLVVVAEQLIAATNSEHARAVGHRAREWSLLVLEEVVVHERLLAILAAPEEEHVDLVHALGGSPPELDEARIVVAPFGALEQRKDVAPIAVDVHEVGVQPTDGERFPGHLPTSPSRAWPNHAGRARPGDRASLCKCRAGARSRLRA